MTQDPGADSPMAERMQSMFSRAVEEQLTEQRQVAGLLAQVQGQLGRLAEQLQEVRQLGERVDGVARLVQERGRDLAEQRAAIAELKSAVDQHTHAVTGAAGGESPAGAAGFADLVAGVGALQQRAEALDAGLRELRQAFSGVAARAAQLPGRDDIEAVRQRLDTLDAVTTRLDALHEELFGVEGLADRMDALAAGQPLVSEAAGSQGPRDIEAVVARAVADSEQRLAEHVDAAILTLAEALLRRRVPHPVRAEAPAVAPPVGGGATAGATPVSDDEPDGPVDDIDVDESDEAEVEVDDYDQEDEYDDDADVDGALASGAPSAPLHAQGVSPAPSWETPSQAPPSTPEGPADQPPDAKRKPWWRPGG